MIERALDRIATLTQKHPWFVLLMVAAITALLYGNTRNLQMRTDLSDLMGASAPETRVVREFIQEFSYGNRFFVVVEADSSSPEAAEQMEAAADRLVGDMKASPMFSGARAGLSETEMLGMVRYFADAFPAFVDPASRQRLAERLSPAGVRAQVRKAAAGMLTPFSTVGASYLAADPLGLLSFVNSDARSGGDFSGFDFEWGSGGRFFSKDHRALLIMAEPRRPGTDYAFALEMMTWVRGRIAAVAGERPSQPGSPTNAGGGTLRMTPVGAHAYAEQNRELINRNIRVASLVSILGNLLLCLIVYRWLSALMLTIVPTTLALVWTTGLIATYPGEINLISLAFIAIIVGLGDDQVTYFFARVPHEMAEGRSLDEGIRRTYVSTGKSVIFCIVTTSTGTLALAMASFKGLAELGLVLTIGLLMLLCHTLLTVPAVMHLVWRRFPIRVSGEPFRILPSVARGTGRMIARHPRAVVAVGAIVFFAACAAIPWIHESNALTVISQGDDPGVAGQRLLSSRFGLEGAPKVLIVQGTEAEVLDRAANLQRALDPLSKNGQLRAVMSPTTMVPSLAQQRSRRDGLAGIDFGAAAVALEQALDEQGLDKRAFEPAVARLRRWAAGDWPVVSVEAAQRALPPGLLDTSIKKMSSGRYVAAVTLYSRQADETASLSPDVMAGLRRDAVPFVEFSYEKIAEGFQTQITRDSRTAALATLAAVILIVTLLFRDLRVGLVVLLPIIYGTTVTVGLLVVTGHRFSGMAVAAFPLIMGIGIDNSIHLVRRFLERPDSNAESLLAGSGAALIQTNLTTVVGFGALLTATFTPLAELGLVTSIGIGFALFASIFLIPAILTLWRPKR